MNTKNFLRKVNMLLVAAVFLFSLSCKDNEDNGAEKTPQLSVTPVVTDIVFAANGLATSGGVAIDPTFTVVTNQKRWTATPIDSWVRIVRLPDNKFRLEANPTTALTAPKGVEIVISAGDATPVKIGVQQLAAGPSLVVEPLALRKILFSSDGATATSGENTIRPSFIVYQNVGEWDAKSDQERLTVRKHGITFTLLAAAHFDLEAPLYPISPASFAPSR